MSMSGAGLAAAGGAEAVLWCSDMRMPILQGGCERRRLRRWSGALSAAALLTLGAAAQGDAISWRDLESRIQYAYYTEDAPALRNLASALPGDESHDTLRGYYAALLAWRQALLASQSASSAAAAPGSSAAPASSTAPGSPGAPGSSARPGNSATAGTAAQLAQRCVSEVDTALATQADFADALALRAVCLEAGGTRTFAGHWARKDLAKALQLAAHNPRVLLADAMSDYELPPTRGGNKERALGKLRRAVAAFEAERSGADPVPGWGAAEAWWLLGCDLLDHGDALAARDALEHALLIAPEFAQARRLMARIVSG